MHGSISQVQERLACSFMSDCKCTISRCHDFAVLFPSHQTRFDFDWIFFRSPVKSTWNFPFDDYSVFVMNVSLEISIKITYSIESKWFVHWVIGLEAIKNMKILKIQDE